jgi:Icc-related predicted phosphoesterase
MRVLLVSDLHYDLRRLDWVLARVADPDPDAALDVLVVAGDLLDIGSAVPLDTQIAVA